MLSNNKIKYLIFIMLFFIPLTYSETVIWQSFDNSEISGTTLLDLTANNLDATIAGSPSTGVTGIIDERFKFTGTETVTVSDDPAFTFGSNDFSIVYWIKSNSTSRINIINKLTAGFDGWYSDVLDSGSASVVRVGCHDGGGGISRYSNGATDVIDGDWHMVVIVANFTGGNFDNWQIYVDNGAEESSDFDTDVMTNCDSVASLVSGASSPAGGGALVGGVDEISIYDYALNSANRTFLYNGGSPNRANQYPFTTPSAINDSLENTVYFEQQNNITIATNTYTSIFSGTFDVNRTTTNFYLSLVSSLNPTTSNEIQCRVLINGINYNTTVNRTNTANTIGSMYLKSTNINLSKGNNTFNYQCRRLAGSGSITLFDSNFAGHLLYNSHNKSINVISGRTTNTTSTTETKIKTVYLTTTNTDLSTDDQIRYLILDVRGQYTYTNTDLMTFRSEAYYDNNNSLIYSCNNISRYGTASSSGIVGDNCIITDFDGLIENKTIRVDIYGSGNGTFKLNYNLKEFISHSYEFGSVRYVNATNEQNKSKIANTNLINTTYEKIANFTISNIDHDSANLLLFSGISMKSISSTSLVNFKFILNNGGQTNSTEFDYIVGTDTKDLILQYMFQNLTLDDYAVSIYAKTNNSNQVNITGGNFIGYINNQNPVTTYETVFFAKDSFNNTLINNFNITLQDNSTFITTTGQISISSITPIINVSLTTAKYFNITENNINITNTTTYNFTLELLLSRYIFNNTFRTSEGNLSITDYTVEFLGMNTTYNNSFSTSTGYLIAYIPRDYKTGTNYTYNITIKPDGFEFAFRNVTVANVTSTQFTELIYFLGFNSVSFSIFDEITRELINNTNFTLSLYSDALSFNTTTSSGSIFINLLSPSDYEIRYSSEGNNTIWSPRSYFFTVINGSTQQINLYAINTSRNDVANKIVFIKDTSDNVVDDAIFYLQRQYIFPDNTSQFITVEMGSTDSEAKADYYAQEESNVKYRFLAVVDGVTLFTSQATNLFGEIDDQQTFRISIGTEVQTIENFFGVVGNVTSNITTNVLSASYVDTKNSISGAIFEVTFFNATTKQTTTVYETSLDLTSGTFTYTATNTSGGTYQANLYFIDAFGNKIPIDADSLFYELPTQQFTPNEMFFTLMMADIFSLLLFVFNPLVGVIATFLTNSGLVFLFSGSKAIIGINMGLMAVALIGIWAVRNKVNG